MTLEEQYRITKTFICSIYRYDKNTGFLYNYRRNTVAGTQNPNGTVSIELFVRDSTTGKYAWVRFLMHRLIYIMYHDTIPVDSWVDFADGNICNSRIENLILKTERRGYHKDYE